MDGVRLRKIEVPRTGSAMASASGVSGVPTLWLYDGRKRVASDTQEVMQRLAKRARG